MLHCLTGSDLYLDIASKLQETLQKHNRVKCGFASIVHVDTGEAEVWTPVWRNSSRQEEAIRKPLGQNEGLGSGTGHSLSLPNCNPPYLHQREQGSTRTCRRASSSLRPSSTYTSPSATSLASSTTMFSLPRGTSCQCCPSPHRAATGRAASSSPSATPPALAEVDSGLTGEAGQGAAVRGQGAAGGKQQAASGGMQANWGSRLLAWKATI